MLPALPLLKLVTFAGVGRGAGDACRVGRRAGNACTVGRRAGDACRVGWGADTGVSEATGVLFVFRAEVLSLPATVELPAAVELPTAVESSDVTFLGCRFFDGWSSCPVWFSFVVCSSCVGESLPLRLRFERTDMVDTAGAEDVSDAGDAGVATALANVVAALAPAAAAAAMAFLAKATAAALRGV